LVQVLLVVALAFGALFLMRVSGARRTALLRQWPALGLVALSALALLRGGVGLGLGLAGLAAIAYLTGEKPKGEPRQSEDHAKDAEARALLGVQSGAGAQEIRAAFRAKMAAAHPDRGGDAREAARLVAARDRLLRR